MNYSVLGILAFCIIVALIIIYIYVYELDLVYDLEYKECTFTTEKNKLIAENLLNVNNLNTKEALLIFGDLPNQFDYWSITVTDINNNLIDIPVSPLNYNFNNVDTKIAVLIVNNKSLCDEISRSFLLEFENINIKYKIIPIYLSNNNPIKVRYTLQLKNKYQDLHVFNSRLYYSKNIPVNDLYTEEKNNNFRTILMGETHLLSSEKWDKYAEYFLSNEKYNKVREIDTHFSRNQNTDIINIYTDNFKIKDDEVVVIIYISHFNTNICNYSNITCFSDNEMVISKNTNKKGKKNNLMIDILQPLEKMQNYVISENLFIGSKHEVNPNTLLKMKVYVCTKQ